MYSVGALAPAAEIEGAIEICIDQVTRELLPKGEARIAGHVRVTYAAPDARSYTHLADFPYERSTQNPVPHIDPVGPSWCRLSSC